MTTNYYAHAEEIASKCNHPHRKVQVYTGQMICIECDILFRAAYKAARKQELADYHAQNTPDCDRCGKPHGARWEYAGYDLCGRCKTQTIKEQNIAMAKSGVFGLFSGPVFKTDDWAYTQKGE